MDDITRRTALTGLAAGAAGAVVPDTGWAQTAARGREPETITLRTTAFGIGQYVELPFTVPRGVTRIDVTMTSSAKLGIGLFDARGAGYQSPGFRGIYGEERSSFFVSTSDASPAFVPGPMPAGTWTVLVPCFAVPKVTQVTVHVVLSYVPQGTALRPGREPGGRRRRA